MHSVFLYFNDRYACNMHRHVAGRMWNHPWEILTAGFSTIFLYTYVF